MDEPYDFAAALDRISTRDDALQMFKQTLKELKAAHKAGAEKAVRKCIEAVCPLRCGKGEQPKRELIDPTGILMHSGHDWFHAPYGCPASPIHEMIHQRKERNERRIGFVINSVALHPSPGSSWCILLLLKCVVNTQEISACHPRFLVSDE